MDILKSVIIAVVVAVVVLFGYSALSNKETPPLGAVAGPDLMFPYFSVNGVTTYYNKLGFTAATTTVCAIKSPNATSTLVKGTVFFRVSSTTASTVAVARDTTAFATTTILGGTSSIAANGQATIVATTTGAAALFPPNTYFVVGMQGGTGTFSPTGQCIANFQSVQ